MHWFIISFGLFAFLIKIKVKTSSNSLDSVRINANYRCFGINLSWHLFNIIDKTFQRVKTSERRDVSKQMSKFDLEQKKALLELLHHQFHPTISNEIRQLLSEYKCRDEEDEDYAIMDEAE